MKYISVLILALVSALFWVQDLLFRAPNENPTIVLLVKVAAILFTVAFALSLVSTFVLKSKAVGRAAALFGALGLGTFAYRVFVINFSDLSDPIVLGGSLVVFMIIALPVAFSFYAGLKKPVQGSLAIG